MALDHRVGTYAPARLATTVARAVTPKPNTEALFCRSFVREHTDFESLEAFCCACPCERDTVGSVQRLSADERDAFVATTTDFETWAEMRECAATSDLVSPVRR